MSENSGKAAAKDYVRIAKTLTEEYEKQIFNQWKQENHTQATKMLKENILKYVPTKEGETKQYKVNFDARLKVIIREAKFLDRIGVADIPNTIINIALQEKDYTTHIDRLNKLLRDYNQALTNLRPVEKKLLKKSINKLTKQMDKGIHNHNWFSLSISEYIAECGKNIVEFKETKERVLQHAANIDQKVQNIENAQLIREVDFGQTEPMDISKFMEYFDTWRNKQIAELVKDYQNIGDTYLRSIEDTTCK